MKVLKIIFAIALAFAAVAGAFLYAQIKKITSSDNQVKKQVEKQEKNSKTLARRYLDFSAFEERLGQFSKERYEVIEKLVVEGDSTLIQSHIEVGSLSYEELVLFYVQRIKELDNNQLNTVTELNPDALIIAKEMDEKKNNGVNLGKLHGIPILLKDNIGTGDKLHNTAGAKALELSSSDRDAFIVKKLRESGAIILGKANLSEWANFMSLDSSNGYSTLGGQTHNPYGNYDVGGSSSGSAAAVASNFVTLAIGTETTGSIVSPSSQNSVVGIKPTIGLWSRDRIIPIAHDLDTAGPITRTVKDAAILLGELVGEDKNDTVTSLGMESGQIDYTIHLDKTGLQGMNIGLVTNKEVTCEYRTGDAAIIDRIKNELTGLGAIAKDIQLEDKAFMIDTHVDVLTYEFKNDVEKYLADIGDRTPLKTMKEIADFNNQDLKNRALFGQYFIEKSRDISTTESQNSKNVNNNYLNTSTAIDEALEANGIDLLLSLNNYLSAVYAPAGYPSITVPAGYRESGEPVGLTFVSTKFREDILIKAAYSYEQGLKHRKQPFTSK